MLRSSRLLTFSASVPVSRFHRILSLSRPQTRAGTRTVAMAAKSLTLSSGAKIPSVGLGTWKASKGVVRNVVAEALRAGYRHLDCACDYGNEDEVGEGIKIALDEGVCAREDIFVTSKLWNTYHRKEHVRPALMKTLGDLRLSYVDLYLIHFPICLKYVPFEERYPPEWVHDPAVPGKDTLVLDPVPVSETWQAMEALVDEGLVRDIGVCNFSVSLLSDLLASSRIRPAMLQVELHPYLQQKRLVDFCKREKLPVTAFSPFGSVGYVELGMDKKHGLGLLAEEPITAIAKKLGKTPAQVALRWAVQRGTCVIPKTSKPERLVENLDVLSFSLSEEDMLLVENLERGARYNDPGDFCAGMGFPIPIYD